MKDFFVKSDTNVKSTGFALYKVIQEQEREGQKVRLLAVGPEAVGIAIKVLFFANLKFAQNGRVLWCKPGLETQPDHTGREITVTVLYLRLEMADA